MKKCTRCGAPIKGNAVVFCPKCKKPLKTSRPVQVNPEHSPQPAVKPSNRQQELKKPSCQVKKVVPFPNHKTRKKKPRQKKKSWLFFILPPKNPKKSDTEPIPVINPMDENYDGYYDDKPTDDNAQIKETIEPELIKRIAFISGAAAVIIILAIILMILL